MSFHKHPSSLLPAEDWRVGVPSTETHNPVPRVNHHRPLPENTNISSLPKEPEENYKFPTDSTKLGYFRSVPIDTTPMTQIVPKSHQHHSVNPKTKIPRTY